MKVGMAPDGTQERTSAEPARPRNVFVLGLNAFHRAKLETVNHADEYRFHGLLEEAHADTDYDIPAYLAAAEKELNAFDGPIDAVAAYMDFPFSTMLPILCQRYGLQGPSLASVLKCEHKYWSRLQQHESIPEHVPRAVAVNPFDDDSISGIPFSFPFWLKPIKSSGSRLGFRITDAKALRRAIRAIRAEIHVLAEPFNYVLEQADLPPEVAGVDGFHCLAEEIIGGRQCTLEGCVFNGEVLYHGLIDSIRARNRVSFMRYEYPSTLPSAVRREMEMVGERILRHVGLNNAGFNIEFFWDRRRRKTWLVEINTRVAQHHSDLFEKVDGVSNHEVPVQVALGRRPHMPYRQGTFRHAATFFVRHYRDAHVTSVPDPDTIAAIERDMPGTVIHLQVQPGMQLSELFEQDSYSYALALVYIGANSRDTLRQRYREVSERLVFGLTPS
jgi:biotin carboxylase